MSPEQKKAATWAAVALSIAGAITASAKALDFLGPSVAKSAGFEVKTDADRTHNALQDQIDVLRKELPRKTYDCIRTKGVDCE